MDLRARTLHMGEAAVRLTGIPFQVLLYLIEHRDRLVGRGELLDRFWDGRDVYEASLTKAIGAIRKALDDSKGQPRFIETRYGEGYRYIGPFAEAGEAPELSEEIAPPPRSRRLVSVLGILLAVILLLTAILWARTRRVSSLPAAPPLRSIAILPLKNLTAMPGEDDLGEGLTDSLIMELGKVRELKVISRVSSFAFRGKETDTREIGRRLGADALLEGTMRRDGETIRLVVRLIRAEDGRLLWSGDVTRPIRELADAQSEIGCSVAESLQAVLCQDPNYRRGTLNLAAFEAYLRGRDRRAKGDPKAAADFFRQAVEIDPGYALGWAGLAEARTVMEVNSMVPPRSLTEPARESAHRAIALDPSLAAPHAALGLLAAFSDRQWSVAEEHFRRALVANPNYAVVHAWYGNTLLAQGRFAEAEAAYLRAQELDPLNVGFINNLGETYYYARQPERCLAQVARAQALDSGNEWAAMNQATCLVWLGRYDEALQAAQRIRQAPTSFRAGILARAGRTAEARRLLPQVLRESESDAPYLLAHLHAHLGDRENAFAWLQKAADRRQANLVSLKIDPAFDMLRGDPRYARMLRGLGLGP